MPERDGQPESRLRAVVDVLAAAESSPLRTRLFRENDIDARAERELAITDANIVAALTRLSPEEVDALVLGAGLSEVQRDFILLLRKAKVI